LNGTTARHDISFSRPGALQLALVFLFATALLCLGMSAIPSTYDEGIMLTGGLRTLAGQIPHQNFYANYGPLSYYSLGWLFRLFGVSILAERILFAIISGLIVATIYGIAASYCSRRVARWTVLSIVLLLFGLNSVGGSPIYPVSLLNLLCVALALAVYIRKLSPWELLGTGMLTGISELIRYDTGVALLGVVTCILAFGIFVRVPSRRALLKEFAESLAAYLLGFALITVPALLYYLSRASFRYFEHDIIVYPSKYYRRARWLPLPGTELTLKSQGKIIVYLPLLLAVIALYIGVRGCLAARAKDGKAVNSESMKWNALLASFGLLGLIMYMKGIVRPTEGQMYLSSVVGLLLVAVLYEHRGALRRSLAVTIPWLFACSVGVAGVVALRQLYDFDKQHAFLPVEMLSQARGKLIPIESQWCKTPGPLTKGICFLPDDDRIQTIEFIRSHTQPSDKLFMGVPHHDRIYANDNITYFATERLPVTKWSHFDPILQNQLPVQEEMVQEFEANPPPYIVLDAEFEQNSEPNESSRSSGVTLLDDYLHSHYTLVETHGMLSIYKRILAGGPPAQ
jgi:4-amino-4-deoxy-L-arabinose transferase-like glycosyltransferase